MAIDNEPAFVDPYVELGNMLVRVDDLEGAAQCFRDAVRVEPGSLSNYANLRAVLRLLAKSDAARFRAN